MMPPRPRSTMMRGLARLDMDNFIDLFFSKDEATQTLIIENIRAYGE